MGADLRGLFLFVHVFYFLPAVHILVRFVHHPFFGDTPVF